MKDLKSSDGPEVRSVLVIDDSPTIHKVVGHTLRKQGLEVVHVQDGASGIAKAKEIKPTLILLDFLMPGMNGYQVSKELGQLDELERIPIVLMSAKGEMMGEKLVRSMGIVDFITKPFSPDALAAVVQHAIDKYVDGSLEFDVEVQPLLEVGERRPDDEPTNQDLSDPRGRVALRGNLGMIPAAETFQLLKFQAHTGILHIARGKAHLEVFLREGSIIFARAANVEAEFLLGRFLVESKAISAHDLEVFLDNRRGTSKLLGEQLVKLGHITQSELKDALGRQTEELMYEALRWGEGEFAFYVTENLPVLAREAGLVLSVDQILMEGFRRVDEWGMIEREIRDFDMVLARSQDATGVIKQVELTPDEDRILSLVDGKRSIKDLVRESRRGSFDVCMLLFRLLSSRIIRKRSGREGSENPS
ncbi:MAG: response regulator [Deltaproteobacteria bacterium]|nr:response regulator [Deltaproteobacteria bacterium]